jgi:hypothetical protein
MDFVSVLKIKQLYYLLHIKVCTDVANKNDLSEVNCENANPRDI